MDDRMASTLSIPEETRVVTISRQPANTGRIKCTVVYEIIRLK